MRRYTKLAKRANDVRGDRKTIKNLKTQIAFRTAIGKS